MAIMETGQRQKRRNSGRPAVWPYTLGMLLVGGLIASIFVAGAIANLRASNEFMTAMLSLAAAGFIIIP